MELKTGFNSICSSQMDPETATVTLRRAAGPKELDLIRQSGMRVSALLTEAYAAKIARLTVPIRLHAKDLRQQEWGTIPD
jgi:hypothetical protein